MSWPSWSWVIGTAEYRQALGLTEGQELPATLGAVGGYMPPSFLAQTFTDSRGHALPYRMLVPTVHPAHAEAEAHEVGPVRMPLVLLLHGAGERGDDNAAQLRNGVAELLRSETAAAGFGVWDLLSRWPDRFAAAVPICGGADDNAVVAARAVPVWAFHGTRDLIVRVERSRRAVAALQTAGGNPRYTEYPDVGHDAWTYAFAEPGLLPWLFSHHRATA